MKNLKMPLLLGASFLLCFVGLILESFASPPWKQWGGAIVLVYVGSLLVLRTIQTVTNKPAIEWLPYIVATFLAIVPVAIFAPAFYNYIAWVVFFSLVGVAAFYFLVAVMVDEGKKIGCKLIPKKPSATQ